MRKSLLFFASISLLTACASPPRYPTEKQWGRTPIFKRDQKIVEVQGNFGNDISQFLLAASKVTDGLTKNQVKELGFDPGLEKQPCESIGWLETSQMVLGSAQVKHASMEEAIRVRKPYSAIRCRAKDIKVRTDRTFTYVNHKDTYAKGRSISLTIIFKKDAESGLDRVAGVDNNGKPIKNHERQSAFLQIMGEFIGVPRIDIDIRKYLPLP